VTPEEAFHRRLTRSFETFIRFLPDGRFERREGYALVSYPALPLPIFNGVWVDGDADVDLRAAVAEIEAVGVPIGVLTYGDVADDVIAVLRELGLTAPETIPAMTVSAEQLLAPADGPEIRAVSEPEELAIALDLAARGFGAPSEWLAAIYSPEFARAPEARIYIATVSGRPVSTALAHRVDGAVGIFNVATPPEERRQGHGAAVTARAVADAFADGAEVGWLQSSAMGESVYRALGFTQVTTYTTYARPVSSGD
jgi:GNAT superfamily N-acetyltransferase